MSVIFAASLLLAQAPFEQRWEQFSSNEQLTASMDMLNRTGVRESNGLTVWAPLRFEYHRPPAWESRLRVAYVHVRFDCINRTWSPVSWLYQDAAGRYFENDWNANQPQPEDRLENGSIGEAAFNLACNR